MDLDAEKAVAAAEAEGRREEEAERLLNKVWRYSLFLYFGTMIVVIAPRLAPASSPAAVPSLPACYDLRHRLTSVLFTVVTVAMQAMLARVLERVPAPAPRLTPLAAWPLGILTWMFVTMFCVSYLTFGVRSYYYEWMAAGVASAANLAMAVRTVMRYLA